MRGPLSGLLSTIDQLANFSQAEKIAATALILLAGVAAVWATRYVRPRLRRRFPQHVGDVVLFASLVGGALVATISLVVLWNQGTNAAQALDRINATAGKGFAIFLALAVLAGAYIVTGFVKKAIDRFVDGHDTISQHQSEIVYRVSQLTVYVSAVSIILGLWKVNLSGLLVGAGFLGIVVGMAARQTLGALLAGFVLMFSRPFEIGDWVEVDDEEGIVTDISIVNTRIQTFAGEYVMIPNDIVSGEKIVNKSRKGRLRIEVEVGVDYEADVERAAELAEETMKDLDEVLTVPTPKVVLKEFGDSAVTLVLRCWIDKPSARRQWRARTAVIESVKETFDREGVKIPFPQRELTGRQESGGFRVADETDLPEATADGGTADGGTTSGGVTEDASEPDEVRER
ncbi:mechanosensitive ion channel family protein [Halorussus gelatinilyticus]|uniref:Mechanosensitive ion channel family protein n=1 Tax=Halorussus gelatinilyticus TaxID=2937524 RepID=A0A8U0IHC0_9EURY|nr:mechanosensitive ion channel family protein [Halorussus gelatinilyticus]UPW00086.1 mechanosensitive ion channel family protein [Halorussus gelatinilyticus]